MAGCLLKLLLFSNIQKVRKIVDILDQTSVNIFQSERTALQQGNEALLKEVGRDKDIMSILCMQPSFMACPIHRSSPFTVKANMQVSEEDRLPEAHRLNHIRVCD